jgi:hypothetical protein
MPNLTGMVARPFFTTGLCRLKFAPPSGEVHGAIELVDDALDDVVFDGHAVGRHVVAADAVEIAPPDDVNGKAELAGDRFDDRFDRKHALRSAIAAKGRIGDGVGFAR